ncbi:MAG TPA: hypothetical protein PKW55_05955 [Spirochaetota bacterium]|nr:hypothetical protein [Spirochaetota bacterium]HOM38428.1 hypothetical protein [Spirochaetota bacterium]HPQ48967.1 hypothetical protein [Spirochaetota bacterium]
MKKKILLIEFLILIGVTLFSIEIREFKPKTFNLKIDSKEELIFKNELPLLDSALVISGVPIGLLPDYKAKLESIFNSIIKETEGLESYKKLDKVLQLLHEKLFKNYKENVTSLKETVDKGLFNCVSSSFIYNLVAEKLGFQTRGILLKDHIFTQININNEWIDVETTVKFGFDPGKRKETQDEFTKLTRFVYVPPSKRSGKEEIVTNWEYLSVLYANIGVEFLNRREFDNALSYFFKAVLIRDNLNEAVHNLKAGYITYSIYRAEIKDFEKAENILKEILIIYPDFKIAKDNLKSIYINWANYLFDIKKYDEGIEIVEKNKDYLTSEEIKNFYLVWAQNLYLAKKYSEAIGVVKKYYNKYSDSSVLKYINDLKVNYVEELIKKGEDPTPVVESIEINSVDELEIRCYLFNKAKKSNLCFNDIKSFLKKDFNNSVIKIFTNASYNSIDSGKIDYVIDFIKYLNTNHKSRSELKEYYEKVIEYLGFYYFKNDPENGINVLKNLGKNIPEVLTYVINSASKILYQSKLYPLLNKKEYDKAYILIKNNYPELPSDFLKDIYKKLISVYASELYKSKKYEESYEVLLNGIKIFPGDSYIKKNYKTVAETMLQLYKNDNIKRKNIEDDIKKYYKE